MDDRERMVSISKKLLAIRQTLKELLWLKSNVDESMRRKMEKAIDSFIEGSASQYTAQELSEKFSTGEKAVDLLRDYIETKAKETQSAIH